MTGSAGLEARLASFGEATALLSDDAAVSYRGLMERVDVCDTRLEAAGVPPGAVVAFDGDFSPGGVALLFALIRRAAVAVPLGTNPPPEVAWRLELGQVEWFARSDGRDDWALEETGRRADHALLDRLDAAGHPGLILFSSGSTGPPKAAVHDLARLLAKFRTARPAMRTAAFLLFDHIGGLNTLWHVLANGGTLVCLAERSADGVAAAIARHRVELLPTSPTFLNLLLLSGAWERHDLSSLRVVTYGTEPMPEATLRRLHEVLPALELRQTYGLSEVGILRAKSESSDSLWVRIGGEGYETQVREGILWIRADSAMLGYLNAPTPFDVDGWFNTGDLVEVRGEWFRILGRQSELINVGGQKVYPGEVESAILELPEVAEVAVLGEPNALLGRVVVAQVVPAVELPPDDLRRRIRDHCRSRLAAHKVPAKVVVVTGTLHSARFKKRPRPTQE
jgi:acyl-CoA synthetase (AMP-forming)/AMP-acid ligase II